MRLPNDMKANGGVAALQRLASWLLVIGLLVAILGLGLNPWRAALEHNAGYVALNRVRAAHSSDAEQTAVWRARGIAALQSATLRQPDNPAAWRALGHLQLLAGDEPSAVAAWQRAGEMLPELLYYARQAEQAGRSAEAHDWYRRLPLVAAEDPAAWLELSMFHERTGDWAAATVALEGGLQVAAPNSDLFYHLALTQRRTTPTDWAAILQRTEQALATDTFLYEWSRLHAHHLRGEALLSLGRPAEARADFAWVVERQPDNYWAVVNLAQLVWQLDGDSARAEELLRAALDLEPDNKWGYRYLAQLYDDLGRSEEARPLFEHVRQLDPTDAAAGEWLARN